MLSTCTKNVSDRSNISFLELPTVDGLMFILYIYMYSERKNPWFTSVVGTDRQGNDPDKNWSISPPPPPPPNVHFCLGTNSPFTLLLLMFLEFYWHFETSVPHFWILVKLEFSTWVVALSEVPQFVMLWSV